MTDWWTPLMYACRDGRTEIVVELLDAGADTEKRDVGGWTALMWACYKGHSPCVEELITRDANVNMKAMHNMTCLHWAAGRGHYKVTELLLNNGARADATDKYGSTPLIWAARKGYISIVESLLDAGASADVVGMYSWTPLLVALQGGHVDVAKVLLQTQPNLNATDKDGMTALALAAKAGYDDIATELIAQGAYLNIADKNGDTVLHHAVKGSHIDIVKVMLRKNPDIDAKGQEGRTVLHLAVDKGNSDVLRIILSANPDKELTDRDGNTPLLRAVRTKNCEMAYLLLTKGAKVAVPDLKGDITLHIAMRARNRKMLELLLKNPRNSRYLYIRNKIGETPYGLDGCQKSSLLSQIFGARSLNSQDAVESQLGYELYSSALADILSSPTLSTPMTVGLFAKWGSGKSFMLNKLREDMKAYMKQSPHIYFEFSWLVFFINFALSCVVGLLLSGTVNWLAGAIAGPTIFIILYILQGLLLCLDRRHGWDWVLYISHTIAKKTQRLRLILYMFFYNRPPQSAEDKVSNSISFVFAESTKLTSLGGEQSLASMIGSLFDALEKRYGTVVTRLYKVFGSEKEQSGRFKTVCCVPYFVIAMLVLVCLLSGVGMIWSHPNIKTNAPALNIVMATLAGVVALSLLLSLRNIGRAIAAYAYSPKRRTMKASQALDVNKSDNFLHVLKNEVEFLSSLVTTMDRHESWQTRLVLIIDGLDSCEQDKVLQVLDAINLIIPENSPFIILLALDPHVIIKGIEANQLQAMHDPSLNGYSYLRNTVHLPFYLQNHGLPRMHTTSETTQLRKWQNAVTQVKQKVMMEKQASVLSSTLSLDPSRPQNRRHGTIADSMMTLEPLHHFIEEMPKNIMKNDYFVDINPRSMRRLMNIIAMAGRLLRANDTDFNWYRLSAWVNITEQWPYRTSWILLHYEELEGRLDDGLSLLSIYERVKDRMPTAREAEPLLDIDRNEKKFVAFLKSHVPKLSVDDLKKFMPSTINLDPFLRKMIKEKCRDQELLYSADHGRIQATPTYYYPHRFAHSTQLQPSVYNSQLANPYIGAQGVTAQPLAVSPPKQRQHKHRIPKEAKFLSKSTVDDICELLSHIKGMSSLNIDAYKTTILLHNINGVVLSDCDLSELKPVLEMKFGDWQIFQSTILAMREVDLARASTESISSDPVSQTACDGRSQAPSPCPPDAEAAVNAASAPAACTLGYNNSNAGSLSSSLANSPLFGRPSSLKLKGKSFSRVDTSTDTVMLENQMIMNAVQSFVPVVDEDDDESPDDDQQTTITGAANLPVQLDINSNNGDADAKSVVIKFTIVDESSGTVNEPSELNLTNHNASLFNGSDSLQLSEETAERRFQYSKLYEAEAVKEAHRLGHPSLETCSAVPSVHTDSSNRPTKASGVDNLAFES